VKIAGLQKVSLIDYPERIAASVFVAGCNLDCWYCHNRWMIDEDHVAEAISRRDLLEWLETRSGLLGRNGVSVVHFQREGGELLGLAVAEHEDIRDARTRCTIDACGQDVVAYLERPGP